MSLNEINDIKEVSCKFLAENQESFEIIKIFEDQIVNLTEETFNDTIQLIKDHTEVFFRDHSTTFSFINIIMNSLYVNILKMERILDIVINFSSEIRKTNMTEYELYGVFNKYHNSINYLFLKKFFTIDFITKCSTADDLTFVKFLPEIERYDSEYERLREAGLKFTTDISLKTLFECAKKDPQQHIKNRNLNFHPSSLHRSIRNDDIDTFQSILSKNNLNINYQIDFSYYERSRMIDSNLSLIQVAATYSAIKIFKFLWMQNDIKFDENLLQYAFFSCNSEIIHLCESKIKHKNIITQAIILNRFDLLNYYIDNFSDKIVDEDELARNELKKIECRNELYDCLTFKDLCTAINFLSIPIIQSCLFKMAFSVKNIDCKRTTLKNNFMLESSIVHFDLFKFLYSQIDDRIEYSILCSMHCFNRSVIHVANDTFKYLFYLLKRFINRFELFKECLKYNIEIASFLLDLQFEEINSNAKDKQIFNEFNRQINIKNLISVIDSFYDEVIVVKMIKLYSFFNNDKNVEMFVSHLLKKISTRMILSLFSQLYSALSNTILLKIISCFEKFKAFSIAEIIKQNLL